MTELYEASLAYLEAGWQVTPLTYDPKGGVKVPVHRDWTRRPMPSAADLYTWFVEGTYPGFGVVCGPPSGNLVVIDIEGSMATDAERIALVRQAAFARGVGHHLDAAWAHASAATPSAGRHLFIQVVDGAPGGNEKLAFKMAEGGSVLLAETRATGGQVGVPPSPGRSWLTGAGPGSSIKVTLAELTGLLDAFRSIDEAERALRPLAPQARSTTFAQPTSMSVAGALNDALMAGEMTWDAVLDPGWTCTGYDRGHGHSLWLRPDYGQKSLALYSAKGFETDRENPHAQLVVHSSSIPHLPAGDGQRLTPGRVFAACWFGGDEGAAYSALQGAVSGEDVHPAVMRLHGLAPAVLERVVDIVASRRTSRPSPTLEPPADPDAQPPEAAPGPTPMPRGVLSPLLERVIDTVSASTQTPPELAAFAALAAVSTATAGGFSVDAGWREPVTLYAIAVADPSERKSSVLQAVATDPLRRAMTLLASMEQPKREAARAAIERQEGVVSDLKKKLRDGSDVADDLADAQSTLDFLERHDVPLPDFLLTDATIEALEERMGEMRGNVAVISAEGTLLKVLVGHYSDGRANVNLLNHAWSHEYVASARVKRGATKIERPHATLGLIVQPTVVDMLANSELTETGFTARWLLCHPRSRVGTRTARSAPMDRKVLDAWLNALFSIMKVGWGANITMTLSGDAAARFFALCDEVEAVEAATDGALRAWLGKSRGQVLRLAAVIALTDRPENREINLEHIEGAIDFIAWQRVEVERLFTTRIEYGATDGPERALAAWLKRRTTPEFTLRDVYRAFQTKPWVRSGGAAAVGEALDSLVAAFVVEEIATTSRSRRFKILEAS